MDQEDSRGLLKSILGFFARKSPDTSTQPGSRPQKHDAWVRTDAYLQHESDEFDDIDPEQLTRTLSAFEDLVQYDSDRGPDPVSTVMIHKDPVFQAFAFHSLIQGWESRSWTIMCHTRSSRRSAT